MRRTYQLRIIFLNFRIIQTVLLSESKYCFLRWVLNTNAVYVFFVYYLEFYCYCNNSITISSLNNVRYSNRVTNLFPMSFLSIKMLPYVVNYYLIVDSSFSILSIHHLVSSVCLLFPSLSLIIIVLSSQIIINAIGNLPLFTLTLLYLNFVLFLHKKDFAFLFSSK